MFAVCCWICVPRGHTWWVHQVLQDLCQVLMSPVCVARCSGYLLEARIQTWRWVNALFTVMMLLTSANPLTWPSWHLETSLSLMGEHQCGWSRWCGPVLAWYRLTDAVPFSHQSSKINNERSSKRSGRWRGACVGWDGWVWCDRLLLMDLLHLFALWTVEPSV